MAKKKIGATPSPMNSKEKEEEAAQWAYLKNTKHMSVKNALFVAIYILKWPLHS